MASSRVQACISYVLMLPVASDMYCAVYRFMPLSPFLLSFSVRGLARGDPGAAYHDGQNEEQDCPQK
jgi:hypothetical protein